MQISAASRAECRRSTQEDREGEGRQPLVCAEGSEKTLSDLGITYDQSAQWQLLAAVPEDDFEPALTGPSWQAHNVRQKCRMARHYRPSASPAGTGAVVGRVPRLTGQDGSNAGSHDTVTKSRHYARSAPAAQADCFRKSQPDERAAGRPVSRSADPGERARNHHRMKRIDVARF